MSGYGSRKRPEQWSWHSTVSPCMYMICRRFRHLCVPYWEVAELLRGHWMEEARGQNEEAVMYVRDSEIGGWELGQCTHRSQNVTLQGQMPVATYQVIYQGQDQRRHSQKMAWRIQWTHMDSMPSSPAWCWGPCEPRAGPWKVNLTKRLITTNNSLHIESFWVCKIICVELPALLSAPLFNKEA